MKLGIHVSNFTYGVPTGQLAGTLEIVTGAEAAGFDRLSVMDHYFQIPGVGPAENEMFEAYSVLGFIAAKTTRMKLGRHGGDLPQSRVPREADHGHRCSLRWLRVARHRRRLVRT